MSDTARAHLIHAFRKVLRPLVKILIRAGVRYDEFSEVIKGVPLRAKRFDFEPEVTAKMLKRRHHIYEVPISFDPREYSQGKKIGLKDAFQAVWTLLKYRFVD